MKVGDPLPEFSLPDQDWNQVSTDDLIGRPCVVYFYPKDDTPGCTRQACTFRDQYEQFLELGAKVVGVSSDSPEDHRRFQEKYNLPYCLLSDQNGSLRDKFEVPSNLLGLVPGRVTFIFDRNGRLIHQFKSQTRAEKHIHEALLALQRLEN